MHGTFNGWHSEARSCLSFLPAHLIDLRKLSLPDFALDSVPLEVQAFSDGLALAQDRHAGL